MLQLPTYAIEPNGFLEDILQAPDFHQLQFHAKQALAARNLDEMMLRTSTAANDGATQSHLFGTLPAALLKLFERTSQMVSDPVDTHFSKSGLPLIWDAENFCGEKQEAYLRLKEYGVRWGISVMVRGERSASRIDFYTRCPRTGPVPVKRIADAHLLGLYLHEAMHSLVKVEQQSNLPMLTPREKECLHWSAAGKTTHEVGIILGISSHTASFHLKNVAAKLNVYGTRHAIAKAASLGMIHSKHPNHSALS